MKYYLVFLLPVRGYFTKPGENGGWDQGRRGRKGSRWANLREIQEVEVTLECGGEEVSSLSSSWGDWLGGGWTLGRK